MTGDEEVVPLLTTVMVGVTTGWVGAVTMIVGVTTGAVAVAVVEAGIDSVVNSLTVQGPWAVALSALTSQK